MEISYGRRLTDKEYISLQGNRCPHCGQPSVEGGNVEIDNGHAVQPCTCTECGGTWEDVHTLTGIRYRETAVRGWGAREW